MCTSPYWKEPLMRPWNSDVNMSINHVENNAGMDTTMQRKQM